MSRAPSTSVAAIASSSCLELSPISSFNAAFQTPGSRDGRAGARVSQLLPRARVLISTILALLRRQITTMKDTSKDENHDAVYFELHQ